MSIRNAVLTAFALVLATGCELLIPLAVAEATKDNGPGGDTNPPVLFELVEADGSLSSGPVAMDSAFLVSGESSFGDLFFEVSTGVGQGHLSIMVCNAAGAGDNPYGGGDGFEGDPTGRPVPFDGIDGGAARDQGSVTSSPCGPPTDLITHCNDGTGRCEAPSSANIRVEQGPAGPEIECEMGWADGGEVRLLFRQAS